MYFCFCVLSTANIWKVSIGCIVTTICVNEGETIEECEIHDSTNIILLTRDTKSRIHLTGFSLVLSATDDSSKATKSFSIGIVDHNSHKLLKHDTYSSKHTKCAFLCELSDKPTESSSVTCLMLYDLDYDALSSSSKPQHTLLFSSPHRKPIHLLAKYTTNSDVLANVCMIDGSKANMRLIYLYVAWQLMVIDADSSKLLYAHDMNKPSMDMDYFVSPTNVTANQLRSLSGLVVARHKQDESTKSHVCALNNLNDMVIVGYDEQTRTFSMKTSSKTPYKFSSFQTHTANGMLVAYDNVSLKLSVFDTSRLVATQQQQQTWCKPLYQVDTRDTLLDVYGWSADGYWLYVIEDRSLIRAYRASDGELLGEMHLYADASSAVCTRDFVVASLQDRKVVSFLLLDRAGRDANEEHAKCKRLESRNVEWSDEDKANYTRFLEKGSKLMDSSSDSSGDEETIAKVLTMSNEEFEKKLADPNDPINKKRSHYEIFRKSECVSLFSSARNQQFTLLLLVG